jgi:hypothetical protein
MLSTKQLLNIIVALKINNLGIVTHLARHLSMVRELRAERTARDLSFLWSGINRQDTFGQESYSCLWSGINRQDTVGQGSFLSVVRD